MNELFKAYRKLERSGRAVPTRFFPDNPPSLKTRLAVFGKEYGEFIEAFALMKHPLDNAEVASVCKECADLIVTSLGLLHAQDVLMAYFWDELSATIETEINNPASIRGLYKTQPMFIQSIGKGHDLEAIGAAAYFMLLPVRILLSEGVPLTDIIAGMTAVVIKNDAKTVANGWALNAAGKIARKEAK